MKSQHGSFDQQVEAARLEPVELDRAALRHVDWKQLGVRFAFGVLIALAASLAGQRWGQRFGGLLLAFPAVLPAALTMLEKKEGRSATTIDALGAILGSVAMLAFALVALYTLRPLGAWIGVGAAWLAWVAVAVGLFYGVRHVIRRTR